MSDRASRPAEEEALTADEEWTDRSGRQRPEAHGSRNDTRKECGVVWKSGRGKGGTLLQCRGKREAVRRGVRPGRSGCPSA